MAFAQEAASPASKTEKMEGPERVIAKVNGAPITLKMLNQAMEERIPAIGHRMISEKRFSEIRREELDKLIVQEILVQEAKRLGMKAEPAAVEAAMKKIRDRFQTEKQFKEALDRSSLTLSDIRQGIERQVLVQKVTHREVESKIAITDADLKEYYDGHKEQFVIPDQIRIRLLLVAVDPAGIAQDWEEGRKKAQDLADRARKGDDFAALVSQFSDDDEVSKQRGGDTGLLHRGQLPYQELEAVAFSHDVGEVSNPVRTLYGYVVFKVEEKRPSRQLSYEELNKELLRREITTSAIERRWAEWIKELRAKADISIEN
jgi:parvulin-like peptidyl-prolyl isomerase